MVSMICVVMVLAAAQHWGFRNALLLQVVAVQKIQTAIISNAQLIITLIIFAKKKMGEVQAIVTKVTEIGIVIILNVSGIKPFVVKLAVKA